MSKQFNIKGWAICCPDLDELSEFGLQGYPVDKSLLPSGLRRRCSMTTQMAVTAAVRACDKAGVKQGKLASIFASLGGEIQITDALCRALPHQDGLISPTQFHNSVHNTTAGYWGIINQSQKATTAIAAVDDTFAMGLLEAWSQLQQSPEDVLLVCYDELWAQYLAPPMGQVPFAAALVLSNDKKGAKHTASIPVVGKPTTKIAQKLLDFVDRSPAATAIPLLHAIQYSETGEQIPLSLNGLCWVTQLQKN